MIEDNPEVSIHGSLPCTAWSTFQYVALARNGPKYEAKLKRRQAASKAMLKDIIKVAEKAMPLGGHCSCEWPRGCMGWAIPELVRFIHENDLYSVSVDGCACGMTDDKGNPIYKAWRFATSSPRLADELATFKCAH